MKASKPPFNVRSGPTVTGEGGGGRAGDARDKHRAVGADGDAAASVGDVTADEARVSKRRARRVDLCDVGVLDAAEDRAVVAAGDRERCFRRPRPAGDVGVAVGVERDGVARVDHVAADIARIDERRAGAVNLRGESVLHAVKGQVGSTRGREARLGRTGVARDVRLAGGVDRNAVAGVGQVAADVASVVEHGAVGAQLCDEGVAGAAVVSQVGSDGDRKGGLSRASCAGEEDFVVARDRDVVAPVVAVAAEVAREDERRTRGVDLRHEGVDPAVGRNVGSDEDREAELARQGLAGDIGVAVSVDRDAVAAIERVVADVTRVQQRRARGVDLGDEGVSIAVVGQVGADGGRERGGARRCLARDVGVARGVDRDRLARVGFAPADVACVHEPGAGGVHLGDEGVGVTVEAQVGSNGGREAGGARCLARDVGVAGGIDRDIMAGVEARPADVARIDQDRGIDDQRQAGIVIAEFEAVGDVFTGVGPFELVSRGNRCRASIALLKNVGLVVAEAPQRR